MFWSIRRFSSNFTWSHSKDFCVCFWFLHMAFNHFCRKTVFLRWLFFFPVLIFNIWTEQNKMGSTIVGYYQELQSPVGRFWFPPWFFWPKYSLQSNIFRSIRSKFRDVLGEKIWVFFDDFFFSHFFFQFSERTNKKGWDNRLGLKLVILASRG